MLFLGLTARGQIPTARLEGFVLDPLSAAVRHARISALNVRTGIEAKSESGEQGEYVYPSLPPGEYSVLVEAEGFRASRHTGLVLNAAATVVENFQLQLGEAHESIVVSARAERVQSGDPELASTITLRDIAVLPQLGRDPDFLAAFQPGVQLERGGVEFAHFNGARRNSNDATLDGIDNNATYSGRLGLPQLAFNTDSVEEIRVITGNATAEYGRSAGAQVELITRSGGNRWSGSLFDYLRNTSLNANDFFNNSSRVARPKLIQNVFGGSIGGPLRHRRTFVLGNFQGWRTREEAVRNRIVLLPEAKAGIFRWIPQAGGAIQEFDIARNDPRGRGIDPLVAANLALLPLPNNFDVGDGLNTGGFRFNNPSRTIENQTTARVDHNLSETHQLFFRLSLQHAEFANPTNTMVDAPFPGQPPTLRVANRKGFAAGEDATLTPRLVNQVRVGWQSAPVEFVYPSRLAGPMLLSNTWTDPLNTAFPSVTSSGAGVITDVVSFVRGTHTLKAGVNLRLVRQSPSDSAGIYPNVTFGTANGNTVPAAIGPSGAIISVADRARFENLYNDLLGRPGRVTQSFYSNLREFQPGGTPRSRHYQMLEHAEFVQDDWKVRRNLTLNVGLRYETFGSPRERDGFQGALEQATRISTVWEASDLRILPGRQWYGTDRLNLAPRTGFAWNPGGDMRTAIRGAWGVYYDRPDGSEMNTVDANTPGFSQTVDVFPNLGGSDLRVSEGIPRPQRPGTPVLQPPAFRQNTLGMFDPNIRTGYVQQYSFDVQRELWRNTVIETGYLGARGLKLMMPTFVNQRRVQGDFLGAFRELQNFRARGTAVSASNTLVRIFGSPAAAVAALGAGVVDQGAVGSAADTVDRNFYQRYAAASISDYYLRNYPQFNNVILVTNDGRMYHDALRLTLRRNQGELKFAVNYTLSKTIDNLSMDPTLMRPIDSFNLRLSRAAGDYNRTHVLNSVLVCTVPVGKGRRFASHLPRLVEAAVGGWEVGALTIWQSGAPFTAISGRLTSGVDVTTWANYAGDRNTGAVDRRGDGVFWFAPETVARFSYPGAGEIGSSGRNGFRGPGMFNLDTSLVKSFRVTERQRATIRGEMYNTFNNVSFAPPQNNLSVPGFGRISAQDGSPRTVQFALRYEF